jgi:hypothetical protein
MTPRERVTAALSFRRPEVMPLQIHPSPGGWYEHGEKLLDLMRACGHDFGDAAAAELPVRPGPDDFDGEGRYHKIQTDEWGTTWEYRIFGVWGHRVKFPLAEWGALETWRPPAVAALAGKELAAARAAVAAHRARYYHVGAWVSLFETMQSLRPFEEVLMELSGDEPEINRLADLLVERAAVEIGNALAAGTDAVMFGDDFGTQAGPLISPAAWRRFFGPRYRRLMEPITRAGKKIFFHSCGQVDWRLEDLAELGVGAIWPQLPLYETKWLAGRCRELGLAVQLHPDRGALMQFGRPEEVRRHVVELVETFRWREGGSWLYLEIDPGFPWGNVEALFEVASELRQSGDNGVGKN